jgi:hypothetical protein
VAFDERLLDQPLPQAAPLTAASCEAQCRELLERHHPRHGISGRVRAPRITSTGVRTAEKAYGYLPTDDGHWQPHSTRSTFWFALGGTERQALPPC